MERILHNFNSSAVKRATLHGRSHLVVPITMIVPGVLPGSKGPLYYPPEEIRNSQYDWNGMPIVVYHTVKDGMPVSARNSESAEKQTIGVLYNTRIAKNGRLVADGWIDVDKTKVVDNRVLDALHNGRPLEVSTGLFTENEDAPPGAAFNGRPYTHVARKYRPDHLAVLPDQVGACSLKDGCGMLVNKKKQDPTDNAFCATGPGGGIDPSCGKDDAGSGSAFDPNRIARMVRKRDDAKRSDKEAASKKMSSAERQHALKKIQAEKYGKTNNQQVSNGDNAMPKLTPEQRAELVTNLLTCNGCGWDEDDVDTLNAMSDQKLMTMDECRKSMETNQRLQTQNQSLVTANAALTKRVQTFEKEKSMSEANKPQTKEEWLATAPPEIRAIVANGEQLMQREKDDLISKITANVADTSKEAVVATLNSRSLEDLRVLVALAPTPAPEPVATVNFAGAAAPVGNVEKVEDELPLPTVNWSK